MAATEQDQAGGQEPGRAPEPAPPRADEIALVILAVIALFAALRAAQVFFIPVVLGVLVSFALNPIVTALEHRHVHRAIGAALLLTALSAAVVLLSYVLRDNVANLLNLFPRAAEEWEGFLERVRVDPQQFNLREYVLWGTINFIALATQLVIVLFLVYFLLVSGDLYKRKLIEILAGSQRRREMTVEIIDGIQDQIERYLLVQLVRIVIVAAATWPALTLLDMENAALWAIAAGVVNTVPYLGPVAISVLVALAAFLQSESAYFAAITGGTVFTITSIEGYTLQPWIMSRAAYMNASAVFVSLLFWGWLWGVWGVLLSVPIMMIVKVVSDHVAPLKPLGHLLGR